MMNASPDFPSPTESGKPAGGIQTAPEPGSGRKPAIIFLHGMFGRPYDWSVVAEGLAPDWEVFNPRLPVFEFPAHKDGLEMLCERVQALMDEQGIGRAVLGGNSLGGHIALLTAMAMPERVSGLVLTGSSGLYERGLEKGFEKGAPRKPGRDWIYSRVREVFWDPVHITEDLLDEIARTISHRHTVVNIVRLARSVRRSNLRSHLPGIRCPVTLIWGEDDIITPPDVAHEFARHLPDAELHFIPQCGHAAQIERPAEFMAILGKSLSRMRP